MRISDLSIKKPVFAWMLMSGLVVFGILGLRGLGVSALPDVDFPQVTVNLTLDGASPETMETDVVDIVEDACMNVEGILDISSSSRQGQATVTCDFEVGRDIDAALQDVQTKVAQAQRRLPRNLDPPVITKQNPEDNPILWISVRGTKTPGEISDIARYFVKERVQTIDGVGEIMMGGFRARNLRLWLDSERLEAHGLTAAEVVTALQREHVEMPAGRIESALRETNVRTRGEAIDTEQFGGITVAERNGAPVRVRDLGLVEDGLEDRRLLARSNGMPSQGLGVKKQRGANAVEIGKRVRAKLEELKPNLPPGVELAVVFDSTAPVEESIHEIGFTLAMAVLLTGLVCWLFLGSISSTTNVLLSIPTSLLGTFGVIYFLGFTLNTFTLLGLSLAVGIVVDDAIMVLENIFRRAEHGEPRVRAALAGAREIAFAALAATAAIIAIFLPVAFMSGIVGKFFFQFGVTISVAVLLSLLEALTLTPSRCAQFLAVGERRTRLGRGVDRAFEGLARLYRASLKGVLRWRWAVLLVGIGAFVASFSLLPGLRTELTPSQDMGVTLARLTMPVGSSVDATDRALRRADEILRARSEVKDVFAAVGGFGGGQVSTGILFVTLQPRSERATSLQQFLVEMRREMAKIPDAKIAFQDLSQQGFSAQRGFPVEFAIRGRDWAILSSSAQEILRRMRASDLFMDIDSDFLAGMPELQIHPDRDRAAAAGVSMDDIARTVSVLVGGARVGTWEDRGRRYDIRVRLLASQRSRPEDLSVLKVRARTGDLVPLSGLVNVSTERSLLAITRKGRERAITVFANVAPGKSAGGAVAEAQRIAGEVLPPGYRATLSGSAQTMKESFAQLLFTLGLGVLVAYMILASQFNSFIHPFTVLAALPFSFTGAVLALGMFDLSLNIYSFIGLILLMGIVKKNSILLVDFTNQRRLLGASRDEALLEACPLRLRPILMTSIATIAGALPAAIAAGPGGEVRQPMAVAVVGGVAVSTLMTLFVVPALYSILDRFARRKKGAAAIEREATEVIADLQAEEIERFAHHKPAPSP